VLTLYRRAVFKQSEDQMPLAPRSVEDRRSDRQASGR
jgi:hypothetical protein